MLSSHPFTTPVRPPARGRLAALLPCALTLLACGKDAPPAPTPAPAQPAEKVAKAKPQQPEAAKEQAAPAQPAEEACAQIVLSSYKGAAHAPKGVARSKEAAKTRAEELLAKAKKPGSDFAALAKDNSDAPSSAPSGGHIGTFTKADWPEIHAPLRDTVFGLKVDEVAPAVVEAPYGFVVLRRCPIERAASRHILIRYKGAKNAGPEITRSKAEAHKLAAELQRKVTTGGDFAELARSSSEDSSAERGGDIGAQPRGRLSAAYEAALFKLRVGEISGVVESEHGYHIIQRIHPAAVQSQ